MLVIAILGLFLVVSSALKSDSFAIGRIVNGEIARPGQFPYQVGVRFHYDTWDAMGGGVLISERWIVTIAHGAQNVTGVTTYLGAQNISDHNESHQIRIYSDKSYVIVHEEWIFPYDIRNDIALIKLPEAIEFNKFIQPASLPTTNQSYENDFAVISGWGKESDSSKYGSQMLRYVEVNVIPNELCSKIYFGAVSEGMICTSGEGGKNTCSGDSGSPLVLMENNVSTVIGVVSFGEAFNCEGGKPSVYTRISSYVDWIKNKTKITIN